MRCAVISVATSLAATYQAVAGRSMPDMICVPEPPHPCILRLNSGTTLVTLALMFSAALKTIAYLFGALTLFTIWGDVTAPDAASVILGQFWFEAHAPSLQVSEAIISRYIDPCGLIVGLGCEPFLWHPLIATTLGWPAALVFMLLTMLFAGFGRLAQGRGGKRASGRSLKRSGDK